MILFSENQRFTQRWLGVILDIALLDPFYLLLNNPGSRKDPMVIFFSLIVPALVAALFRLLRLETRIEQDHIQFRFFPDYGGWGIRCSLSGKGSAYNVSGNRGIQVKYKDGRRAGY